MQRFPVPVLRSRTSPLSGDARCRPLALLCLLSECVRAVADSTLLIQYDVSCHLNSLQNLAEEKEMKMTAPLEIANLLPRLQTSDSSATRSDYTRKDHFADHRAETLEKYLINLGLAVLLGQVLQNLRRLFFALAEVLDGNFHFGERLKQTRESPSAGAQRIGRVSVHRPRMQDQRN